MILPILSWAILSFFPIHLIQHLPFAFLPVAVGQFMLFRRKCLPENWRTCLRSQYRDRGYCPGSPGEEKRHEVGVCQSQWKS